MNRNAKNISSNFRTQIGVIKGYILGAKGFFDGSGYPFKKALQELRQRGYKIKYNKFNGMYSKDNK